MALPNPCRRPTTPTSRVSRTSWDSCEFRPAITTISLRQTADFGFLWAALTCTTSSLPPLLDSSPPLSLYTTRSSPPTFCFLSGSLWVDAGFQFGVGSCLSVGARSLSALCQSPLCSLTSRRTSHPSRIKIMEADVVYSLLPPDHPPSGLRPSSPSNPPPPSLLHWKRPF